MEIPVDDVVATVFNDPVAAIGAEDGWGRGLLRWLAGDTQCLLNGEFAGLFVKYLAFDHEHLADVGEVEEGVQRRAAPDAPRFNAAVIGGRDIDVVRQSTMAEQKRDIFLKFALIAFDGEMVMRVATDQIVGERALG